MKREPASGPASGRRGTRARLIVGVGVVLVLAAACRPPEPAAQSRTAIPEATLEAFRCEPPVENEVEAVILAQRAVATTRLEPVAPPTVRSAERVTYGAAHARTGREEEATLLPEDHVVWLIILEGEWQIIPPGPNATPEPATQGCVFVIIDPQDCRAFEVGTVGCR